MAQQLRLHVSTAEDRSLIPGQGTKIPHGTWHGQKQTNKQTKIVFETYSK